MQHHHRIRGGEDRQGVAGRRRVRDVAANRAAILDLNAADFARGRHQHRQLDADERGSDHVRERRERANRQRLAPRLDRPQRVEAPQIQEALVLQRPEVEGDIEIGTARERRQRTLVAEHVEGVAQRAGLKERARGD